MTTLSEGGVIGAGKLLKIDRIYPATEAGINFQSDPVLSVVPPVTDAVEANQTGPQGTDIASCVETVLITNV